MSTPVKFFGVILGVPAVIIGLLLINAFVYPFSSKHPNFSDVYQAFSKLQFPSDWQEINSSENRGVAGRGCDPFNSSGCFHKSKTFKLPTNVTDEDVKKVLAQTQCSNLSSADISSASDTKPYLKFSCTSNSGTRYAADLNGTKGEVYVVAKTY
jgi:hypothetical protein